MNPIYSTHATLSELIHKRDFSRNPDQLSKNEDVCGEIFASLYHERYERQRPLLLSYLVFIRLAHSNKGKNFSNEHIDLLNCFTMSFCEEYGGYPSVKKDSVKKELLQKKFTAFWNSIFTQLRINNIPEIFDLALCDFETLLHVWTKRRSRMEIAYNEKSISIILGSMSQIVKGG